MTKVIVRKRWRQRVINGVLSRRCCRCASWRPANADHFHKKGAGLHSECKPCGRAIASAYQRARYLPSVRKAPVQRERKRTFDARALLETWK